MSLTLRCAGFFSKNEEVILTSKKEDSDAEIFASGIFAYDDLFSPEEKAHFLLDKIKSFFRFDVSARKTNELVDERRISRIRAIRSVMHIFPDGTPAPLPLTQKLWHGTIYKKLASRLEFVENKANQIVDTAAWLYYSGLRDHVDVFLTQHFVLEQV
jgi:hypothetical protein